MGTPTLNKPMSKASGISFQNICFRYFKDAEANVFDDFSMAVKKDKITVLTGPSGCGKSTLLYLAAGLYPEHAGLLETGEVLVDGKNIQAMDALARSRSVRLVFQNADLQFCFTTVEKELVFSMEAANVPPEDMPARFEEALQAVGLKGFEDRSIHTLSGGEKQRLSLACQLVSGATWFLFDEVFAQVDEEQVAELVQMLVKLKCKYGLSYLVVDHHLENWASVADEYFLLNQGGQLIAGPDETQFFTGDDWNRAGVIAAENCYPIRGSLAGRQLTESATCSMDTIKTGAGVPAKAEVVACPNTRDGARPFISIHNLSVQYGEQSIFDRISFSLDKGRIYALMGPSGIGKTSLLKALGGFIPHAGEIVREDTAAAGGQAADRFGHRSASKKRLWLQRLKDRLSKIPDHPYTMRYIFQNPQDQFLKETVSEEILLSLKDRFDGDVQKQKEEAIQLLKRNALWEMRRQAPFQLSEGQQRRLAVITLLSEKAELILCDEPTYAQDYKNTLVMMDLLVHAAREQGSTILFTTHDRNLANHYADHILFLDVISDEKGGGRKDLCII